MATSSVSAFNSPAEPVEIATDAYVYAYPLVLMAITHQQTSNYAAPTGNVTQAPVNQFSHARAFPPADFKDVVRANVDTLYSTAVLDLAGEPIVLSVPATDRYFLLPMLSTWTDVFAVPGSRTTGRNAARDFLVVGPAWQGAVPAGLSLIRSPTRFVSVAGRTQTNGVDDYDAVHAIQAGYRLTPLSAWGAADYTPPTGEVDPAIDMATPPPDQVAAMDAAAFFGRVADLLQDNPPQACDYPMIHRLARLGFVAGQPFDLAAAPPDIQAAFVQGAADGQARVAALGDQEMGANAKGWVYTTRSGAYGVDYAYRAAIAVSALGENLPEDAIYPALATDSDGNPLDGNTRYVLHFAKEQLPPVDGFWSLTAYDAEGHFIPNSLNRQAIGDRDPLHLNADGSLDLFIQADSPGSDNEANWLPVARSPFTLLLRLYWPRREILDGAWSPPPIQHAS